MKRGQRPKPTALQIAEGDPRKLGKNKLREKLAAEPQAQSGYPPCPDYLTGMARATWFELAEQIELMGIDKRPDVFMLEGACIARARAWEAEAEIDKYGQTYATSTIDKESGEVIILKITKNPAVAIAEAAWSRFKAFASEFGLSPVSRTRLAIEKRDTGEQDLATILSKPREPKPVPPPVN